MMTADELAELRRLTKQTAPGFGVRVSQQTFLEVLDELEYLRGQNREFAAALPRACGPDVELSRPMEDYEGCYG